MEPQVTWPRLLLSSTRSRKPDLHAQHERKARTQKGVEPVARDESFAAQPAKSDDTQHEQNNEPLRLSDLVRLASVTPLARPSDD